MSVSPVGLNDGDVIFPWCQQQSTLDFSATAVAPTRLPANKRHSQKTACAHDPYTEKAAMQ